MAYPPPPGAALSEFPSPPLRHRSVFLPHQIFSQEFTASHTYNYPANLFLPHESIMLIDDEETSHHRAPQADDNDDDGEVVVIFALPVQSGAHEDMTTSEGDDDGLSEEVIARFLKTTAVCEKTAAEEDCGDPKLCAVCQDNLYQEDRTVGILGCDHDFHADCIGKWLQIRNICPLCKDIAIKIIY
ncbi:hypothetical protein C2S52_016720 [Perilla frutescens var. hirtella]|nr:hypothetical protein C2S52_016720 [Perilla frutescens var. hirtella]